jgi:hypothetical protein
MTRRKLLISVRHMRQTGSPRKSRNIQASDQRFATLPTTPAHFGKSTGL